MKTIWKPYQLQWLKRVKSTVGIDIRPIYTFFYLQEYVVNLVIFTQFFSGKQAPRSYIRYPGYMDADEWAFRQQVGRGAEITQPLGRQFQTNIA